MHSRNLPCFTGYRQNWADSEQSSNAAFREHYATITIERCFGNSVKDEVGGRPESLTLWGVFHKTRSAPSFISCACPVDLSNRDWKSAPPCSQAMLMSIAVSASPVELRQVSTGEIFRKVQRTNGCERLVQLIIKKIKNRLGGTGLLKHEGAYIGIYQSVHRLPS